MAAMLSLHEEDLTCPICCDIFKEPVVLKCSHSFCGPCLQTYWSQHGSNRDCPVCRAHSLDDPVPSLTLKNLCESCVLEDEGPQEMYCDPGEMCPLHGEALKLYCRQDKQPICVVCHTSRKHKQHDCCPVSEAIADVQDQMASSLTSLMEKQEAFQKMKEEYQGTMAHIQVQAQFVAKQTHKEFEKLYDFLRAEEEARMEALRREEEQKTEEMRRKIEEMELKISSLSESIQRLVVDINLEGISLLHKCSEILERAQCAFEAPVMPAGALLDVAKHVDSSILHVWAKMQRMTRYTPVTLDPNTADLGLVLSDDLTSVYSSDEKEKLPDNPERLILGGVLGSEGFSSGRHVWTVDVGDSTGWMVGVAKECIARKAKVSAVEENGYLCLVHFENNYFAGTSPLTTLKLKESPQKVGVQLDWDKGRVSFYDARSNERIFTFKRTFTGKVFPYFWVACQQGPLTVEPVQVSLQLVESTA